MLSREVKNEKKKELTWNLRRRYVHFVRDAGLLQLVGGLVVCWNELAVDGQGAWRNWDVETGVVWSDSKEDEPWKQHCLFMG